MLINGEYFSTLLVGGYFYLDQAMPPTTGTAKLQLLLDQCQGIGLKLIPGGYVTAGTLISSGRESFDPIMSLHYILNKWESKFIKLQTYKIKSFDFSWKLTMN